MSDNHLRLYAWADAPEEYKQLSTNGGDENWVLVGPREHPAWEDIFWDAGLRDYVQRFGWPEEFMIGGERIVIFSHA